MVLANQTSVRGIDYVDVLSRANLHDSFSRAWGCPLEDHVREEDCLGSVSEDVIIEKTVAKAPELWGFTVTRIDSAQPTFHLIPFTQDVSEEIKDWQSHELNVVRRDHLSRLEDSVKHVRENRPENPDRVSYALDDMEFMFCEMEYEREYGT